MRIKTTEAMRRFNAELEIVDLTLGIGAADRVTDPRKLVTLLNLAGHFELSRAFRDAGIAVGYFDTPGERPADPAVCETKGECEPFGPTAQQLRRERERYQFVVRDNKALMDECRYLRDQLRAFSNQVQAAGLLIPPAVKQCIS